MAQSHSHSPATCAARLLIAVSIVAVLIADQSSFGRVGRRIAEMGSWPLNSGAQTRTMTPTSTVSEESRSGGGGGRGAGGRE